MNNLFPIYIKENNMRILIVGGGKIALEKLNTVVFNSPNSELVILAKKFSKEIIQQVKGKLNVILIQDEYHDSYLNGFNLIIAATRNRKLNYHISNDAKEKNILFNAADMPDYCDFYLGSVIRKGDLKIGISTNGKSPVAAVRIKELLNELLPDDLDSIIQNLYQIRSELKGEIAERVVRLKEITEELTIKRSA